MKRLKNSKFCKTLVIAVGMILSGSYGTRASLNLNDGGTTTLEVVARDTQVSFNNQIEDLFPPSLPFDGAPIATQGISQSQAQFHLAQAGFSISSSGRRSGALDSRANVQPNIFFSVSVATTYTITGSLSVDDPNQSGKYVGLAATLTDVDTQEVLYNSSQESFGTVDQLFQLGGSGGNVANDVSGSSTGVLLAGHRYKLYYGTSIYAANSGDTANFVGTLNFSLIEAGPAPLVGDYIYWTERTDGPTSNGFESWIKRTKLDGTSQETIFHAVGPDYRAILAGLDLDVEHGFLYTGDGEWLFRLNLDGTARLNLVPTINPVQCIKLDRIHGKIYWNEGAHGNNAIRMCNLDGTNPQTLIDVGFAGGFSIALNPADKLYFFFNVNSGSDTIQSMNLDGSGIMTIYDLGGPDFDSDDLDIDLGRSKLYRTGFGETGIFQAALDGSAPYGLLLSTPDGANSGISYDAAGDKLYYFNGRATTIEVVNLDGTGRTVLVQGISTGVRLRIAHGTAANQPPICDAGPSQTVEAQGALTSVGLDASGSSDPDGDLLEYEWSVAANSGASIANPGSALTSGLFPIGPTLVTVTVSDGKGGVSLCDTLITVQDTIAPVVVCTTDKISLWPPNHSMQDVLVAIQASDTSARPQDLQVECSVRSNEPDNSGGDGSTTGDTQGQDGYSHPVAVALNYNASLNQFEGHVQLRAERAGNQSSRIYSINCLVKDNSGNTANASCVVVVPHDRRKN
jgi:hypothetical protein